MVGATATAHAFGDGTYIVGEDIQPGWYEAPGGKLCFWSLLRGDDDTIMGSLDGSHVVENQFFLGRSPDHVASTIAGMYMGCEVFGARDRRHAVAVRTTTTSRATTTCI